MAAGVAGVVLAAGATAWCGAKLAPVLARDGIEGFDIDGRVLAFALLVSLATAIVFGILPALRGSGVNICEALKESGPGHSGAASRQRLTGLLVVLEVTLSVVLVTTAGLLVSSITQYWRLDWGFPMDRRLVAGITPSEATYATEAARLRFYTELLLARAAVARGRIGGGCRQHSGGYELALYTGSGGRLGPRPGGISRGQPRVP